MKSTEQAKREKKQKSRAKAAPTGIHRQSGAAGKGNERPDVDAPNRRKPEDADAAMRRTPKQENL